MKEKSYSFDKYASEYNQHSVVQKYVAEKLAKKIMKSGMTPNKGTCILDIGAGSGNMLEALSSTLREFQFGKFVAIDSSPKMLGLHGKLYLSMFEKRRRDLSTILADFDKADFKKLLSSAKIAQMADSVLVCSSSALQWSKDLHTTMGKIADLNSKVAFSVFGSKSLDNIHSFLGTKSPIYKADTVREILESNFNGMVEVEYKNVEFDSREDLLIHLKKTGLLGGGLGNTINLGKARNFRNSFKDTSLTYEIIYFVGESRRINRAKRKAEKKNELTPSKMS